MFGDIIREINCKNFARDVLNCGIMEYKQIIDLVIIKTDTIGELSHARNYRNVKTQTINEKLLIFQVRTPDF